MGHFTVDYAAKAQKGRTLIGFMKKALLKKKMHVVAVNNCMASP